MSDPMNSSQGHSEEPPFDNRMIPVMREAVLMVQMVLFRQLKEDLAKRYGKWLPEKRSLLAGAVVNNLFGARAENSQVADFAANHRELIEEELRTLHNACDSLIPFITDALRMMTICDNQEGIHSIGSLLMAKELGLLLEARALPLPSTFMINVRTLAAQNGLVEPMQAAPPPEDPLA